MVFVFDLNKSKSNKRKHGIDFGEATLLWNDPRHIEYRSAYEKEPRHIVIGTIDEIVWTAIVTYRGDTTRLISVRRARKDERESYFASGT